jgi:hypothetical protein
VDEARGGLVPDLSGPIRPAPSAFARPVRGRAARDFIRAF